MSGVMNTAIPPNEIKRDDDLIPAAATRGFGFSKAILDYPLALFLIFLSLPVMVMITLVILTSGLPVIFAHERVGRDGRVFRCYKFRTMVRDANSRLQDLLARHPELRHDWLTKRKLKYDPRITWFGKFLRRTSLDELPQLFNVLRGDMSIVGPRPVMMDELARYGADAAYYLQVKPGITGLWQVSGRNDLDFPKRVALDVYYVQHMSLAHDCAILLRTPAAVFKCDGAY
jgi:undecaprenyl-phosphate galactose phosphotransferase